MLERAKCSPCDHPPSRGSNLPAAEPTVCRLFLKQIVLIAGSLIHARVPHSTVAKAKPYVPLLPSLHGDTQWSEGKLVPSGQAPARQR